MTVTSRAITLAIISDAVSQRPEAAEAMAIAHSCVSSFPLSIGHFTSASEEMSLICLGSRGLSRRSAMACMLARSEFCMWS